MEYTPWKIEQLEFDPAIEPDVEHQLMFSNNYISQSAYFEELYSGPQWLATFLKGIEQPIPNFSTVTIRMQDDSLNLNYWKVEQFYRCLHRDTPLLERQFRAVSPKGNIVSVKTRRSLSTDIPERMCIEYEVTPENYEGMVSMLSLIGGKAGSDLWYPLQTHVDENVCWIHFQQQKTDIQVCGASRYEIFKNDDPIVPRSIKIEKQRLVGYALMEPLRAGERLLLRKHIAIVDSRTHAVEHLA